MTRKITTLKTATYTRLLCCVLLMLGLWTTNANAQAAYSNNFNANATGWTGTITRTTATTACGSASMRLNMYSSVTTGTMISPSCGTSNAALATLSYSYKVANWSLNTVGTPNPWGSFNVQYGATATGPWTTFQTINSGNHVVSGTCSTVVATFTPPAGALFIKWDAFWTSGDYYINFDNVTVSQAAGGPCSTPAPGNTVITAGNNPSCSGASLTLGLQNATGGTGVTYQWYANAVLQAGATNASYVTSQSVATTYYCDVTCSTGPSTVSSNSLTVTMNTNTCTCPTYCVSTNASYDGSDYIANVTINGWSRTSTGTAVPCYDNQTGTSTTTLTAGNTYTCSITAGTDGSQNFAAFIDFNQNGSFLDASENIFVSTAIAANGTTVLSFTVPSGALVGTSRLRVVDRYNATAVSCLTATGYGETEDYCITIAAPAPCSGTPAPGNTVASSSSVCAGGTSNLSLQNATPGTGVTYQWYNTGGVIGGATNATYTTPALFASETYHCDVTCSTGPATGSSSNTTINIVAAPVGGTATGPATGVTYANLAYNVTGTTGSLQWQYSTTAAAGPYTDIPAATTSSLNISANGAGTYYVRCKAYNAGCTDAFSNVITTVVTVAGDDRCSPNVLALGVNGPYTNSGATVGGGDPVPPAGVDCNAQNGWCPADAVLQSNVWFTFTPAVSGKYAFRLDPNRNFFDSQFALYSSASCAGPFTQIAANDDSSASPYNSYLAPNCLIGGTTYYFQVDGYSTTVNTNFGILIVKSANVAPVIGACPSNISQCDNHVATWTNPTATDDCGGATVVCSPASGSTFAAGTTTVNCTATDADGATSACSFSVLIKDSPVIGACPSDITSCNPVVTFATPSATGDPAPSVSCSPASGSTFAPGTTSVTCTATNACGSSSCSFNVIVNTPSTAATSATSNALYGQVCSPSSVTLTANGGSLGTGGQWVWYDGGCGSGASVGTGSPLTITPAVGAHNYYVRAEGACPATACQNVAVTSITAPPSGTIHYTATLSDGCVGAPAQTISVNAIANCTFYNWASSEAGVRFNGNPSPYQTTTPTVNVTFVSLPVAGASGWSICVFGGNACGNTNNICTWARATVSTPTSITGSVIGCPGSTGNAYSSAAVAGSASYQWTGSAGITVVGNGAQAVTVDFSAGFVSGTLSVHGQNACGYNGADRTITINRAPGLPGAISGTSYPCPNGSASFSVAAVAGAADYTWTTSVVGAIVTGTTNSCSIAFPASIPAGSTVSVTANSSCPFSSPVRSKGIASGMPNVPGNISGPAYGQCGQAGVSYSIGPVANATGYSWSSTCGTIVGPTNLSGINMDWPSNMTSCVITVMSTNACGSSGPRTLTVTGAPNTPTAISGNLTACQGGVEQYCASGSTGATSYQWIVPAGAVILGPSNGSCVLVQWGTTGGTLICKAANDCGVSGSKTQAVTLITCRASQVNSTVEAINAEVYPNPATEKATVKFTAATAGQYHLSMTNVLGQNVLSADGAATEGINMIELNLNSVAKGVYMLNIMSGDNNEQIRVVVE